MVMMCICCDKPTWSWHQIRQSHHMRLANLVPTSCRSGISNEFCLSDWINTDWPHYSVVRMSSVSPVVPLLHPAHTPHTGWVARAKWTWWEYAPRHSGWKFRLVATPWANKRTCWNRRGSALCCHTPSKVWTGSDVNSFRNLTTVDHLPYCQQNAENKVFSCFNGQSYRTLNIFHVH